MRRLFVTVFATFCSIVALAGKEDITIKGTIVNADADSIIISYTDYQENWLDYHLVSVGKKLDRNGNFLVTVPVPHDYTILNISIGKKETEVYCSPGDKLVMTADAADLDNTISYKGVGMDVSVADFMVKYIRKYGLRDNFHRAAHKTMEKEPETYVAAMKELVQRELDFLVENAAGLPASFIRFWNVYYEYTMYNNMLIYPYMHEIVKHGTYDIDTIPPANFKVVTYAPPKFNDELMHILPYRNFVNDYYSQILTARQKENPGQKDEDHDAVVDKVIALSRQHMPAKTAEYVFAYQISSAISNGKMSRVNALYNQFTERYPDSEYSDFLAEGIARKKKLSPGAPAIDFTVYDEDGRKIKLSSLKGKVVYIDFWASWCGPCRAEFKYMKEIKERFSGRDVVFVYASIDMDEGEWNKAREKYDLQGLHVRLNGEEDKTAVAYGINGVPYYFLVDREGNFALEHTPRPSQTAELVKAIESLL